MLREARARLEIAAEAEEGGGVEVELPAFFGPGGGCGVGVGFEVIAEFVQLGFGRGARRWRGRGFFIGFWSWELVVLDVDYWVFRIFFVGAKLRKHGGKMKVFLHF